MISQMEKEVKSKINCLVCDTTYPDNNSNNPNHAIYLGFAEGRKNLVDKPVFIHQQSSCIAKARKIGILDKSGKFHHCIVCGHRVNLTEKILSGEETIKQNGYLVDTNAWIHTPLPLEEKHSDFVISNCYEQAFGHSNFPPKDILDKRKEIIEKYVIRNTNPKKIEEKKEEKEIPTSIINEDQNKKHLYFENFQEFKKEDNDNNNDEKLIDLSLKGFKERGIVDNFFFFIVFPIIALGLFLKFFFLFPVLFHANYRHKIWFWPLVVLYLIIFGSILNFILENRYK